MLEKIVEAICCICGGTSLFLIFIDTLCFASGKGFPSYERMTAALVFLLAVISLRHSISLPVSLLPEMQCQGQISYWQKLFLERRFHWSRKNAMLLRIGKNYVKSQLRSTSSLSLPLSIDCSISSSVPFIGSRQSCALDVLFTTTCC